MKIKEAIDIINNNNNNSTVVAKKSYSFLHIYHRDVNDDAEWFLSMPIHATNWNSILTNWDYLTVNCNEHVDSQDLARVMDVVQQLLDTPVKKRFSEKKYYLRWIDDGDNYPNYFSRNLDGDWDLEPDKYKATIFTESELEQLKKDNPHFAPTIDIIKEPTSK